MSDLHRPAVPSAQRPATGVPARRRAGHERGMATVEYAIGIVLVLVIVGAVIVSIQQGWFAELAQELIEALGQTVIKSFGVDLPWVS